MRRRLGLPAGAVTSRPRKPGPNSRSRLLTIGTIAAAAAIALAACGGDSPGDDSPDSTGVDSPATQDESVPQAGDAEFPEIVTAEATPGSSGTFDFAVTMSSPYDTPERYADGWRVLTVNGEVLGEMTLLHDHAGEQPFTRTQTSVAVPAGVETVVIEGRDLENGYGGATFEVELP